MAAVETTEQAPHELPIAEELGSSPTETFDLHGGKKIYMANGLQPVGEEDIEIQGSQQPVEVLAKLHLSYYDKADREVWLTRPATDLDNPEADRPVSACRVEEDNGRLVSRNEYLVDLEQPLHMGPFVFKPKDKDHQGWFSVSVVRDHEVRATSITVAEGSHPVEESFFSREEKLSARRWKKIGAVILTAAALRMVVSPDGIYNRIADPGENAGAYVTQTFDRASPESAGFDRAAVGRVAEVMAALDAHNFDRVRELAGEYKGKPAYSPEQLADFQKQLAEAKTGDAAIAVVDRFLSRYGAWAAPGGLLNPDQINTDGFRESVQHMGSVIIDAYGELPEAIVRLSIGASAGQDRETYGGGIEFAFGQPHQHSVLGSEAGHYEVSPINGQNGRIVLYDNDLGIKSVMNATSGWDGRSIVLHELAHGIFRGEDMSSGADGGVLTHIENLGSYLIGDPQFVSDYATSSPEEEAAEAGSDVLSGKLVNPDDVLQYESRANRARLADLIRLEEEQPHVAAYLIAHLYPELADHQP